MKKILMTIAVVASFGLAANASAWGDREQGIVTGIAATLLGQEILENRRHRHDHHCGHYQGGSYGSSSVIEAYEQGVRDRYLRELQYERSRIEGMESRLRLRAYRCGLDPRECD